MTDVKFMSLSENGNPATTDSVLIGNAQDGLKRTTLESIKNLLAPNNLFHFEEISCNASDAQVGNYDPNSKANNGSVKVTAPDVAGYTFKFWLSPQTNAFFSPCYITSKTSATATIWVQNITPKQSGTISSIAVYVKNELA